MTGVAGTEDTGAGQARSRWTRQGGDWLLGKLAWQAGLSVAQAAEVIGVDRSAFFARIRLERWTRAASDAELIASLRSVALAASIRDLIAGCDEAVAMRAKSVEAIMKMTREPPRRRERAQGAQADQADTGQANSGQAGATANDEASAGEQVAGELGQRIRAAIIARLDRIGCSVAETGAGVPAGGEGQRADAGGQMAPPARAGPGANAA